ncbi:hypothetical protein GCM10020331_055170 [Ectobacillus funiculus]
MITNSVVTISNLHKEVENEEKNTIILPLSLLLFALTALSGGYWDVWWHVMKLVETFYTLPHLVIYASIF